MLVIGTTGRRGKDEPGDAPYDERVLGILHQELKKDGCCSPSRQTNNHQNGCFHLASGTVSQFL